MTANLSLISGRTNILRVTRAISHSMQILWKLRLRGILHVVKDKVVPRMMVFI